MCLLTNQTIATILSEDMIVHKHFLLKESYTMEEEEKEEDYIFSSYKRFPYKMNVPYITEIPFVKDCQGYLALKYYSYMVEEGFHSYVDAHSAIYNDYEESSNICIIPKGSYVIAGEFNSENDCIVSNKIIITNVSSRQLKHFNLEEYKRVYFEAFKISQDVVM